MEEWGARNNPQYEVREATWAEETVKRCLLGPLENLKIGGEGITEEQALAIRERLINEIPAAGFIEMSKECLHYVANYGDGLEPDDLTLIKQFQNCNSPYCNPRQRETFAGCFFLFSGQAALHKV